MSKKTRNSEIKTINRSFVSESVVSQVTGRSARTLQKDRALQRGPFPYYKIGKQVVYDLDECIAIVDASRQTGNTEPEVRTKIGWQLQKHSEPTSE